MDKKSQLRIPSTLDTSYTNPLDSLDVRGLDNLVLTNLFEHLENCQLSKRDFGIVVKKPNKVLPLISNLSNPGFPVVKKEYVVSESIMMLRANASTPMMSHEGEIFEVVGNIGPADIGYTEGFLGKNHFTARRHEPGEYFFSVNTKYNPVLGKYGVEGFYHSLRALDGKSISISKITTVVDSDVAMKDGKLIEYGINRPPNTWKPVG